jgi:phosphoenolpyruvate carboxykinase (ATP)
MDRRPVRHWYVVKIEYTRAMIRAALSGALDAVRDEHDPIFNLSVPTSCPDVPADILSPRHTWPRPSDYDAQAAMLAAVFRENFTTFAAAVTPDVLAAGPTGNP